MWSGEALISRSGLKQMCLLLEDSEAESTQKTIASFGSQHQYSVRFNRVSGWEGTDTLSKLIENERSGIPHQCYIRFNNVSALGMDVSENILKHIEFAPFGSRH